MIRNFTREYHCLGLNNFNMNYIENIIFKDIISNDDDDTIYLLSFNVGRKGYIPCKFIFIQNFKLKNNLYSRHIYDNVYRNMHSYMNQNKINLGSFITFHIKGISIGHIVMLHEDLTNEFVINKSWRK